MAATWKTDPKDRTNFTDILDAFIDSNPTCRHKLLPDPVTSRKGQSAGKASCELPSLYEADEGTDGGKTEEIAIVNCDSLQPAACDTSLQHNAKRDDDGRRSSYASREQQENPYMVPDDLEVVVIHSQD